MPDDMTLKVYGSIPRLSDILFCLPCFFYFASIPLLSRDRMLKKINNRSCKVKFDLSNSPNIMK